jgi:hypothetical protein
MTYAGIRAVVQSGMIRCRRWLWVRLGLGLGLGLRFSRRGFVRDGVLMSYRVLFRGRDRRHLDRSADRGDDGPLALLDRDLGTAGFWLHDNYTIDDVDDRSTRRAVDDLGTGPADADRGAGRFDRDILVIHVAGDEPDERSFTDRVIAPYRRGRRARPYDFLTIPV